MFVRGKFKFVKSLFLRGIGAESVERYSYGSWFAQRNNWTESRWLSYYLDIAALKKRRVHKTEKIISFTQNPQFIKNPRHFIDYHYGRYAKNTTIKLGFYTITIYYFKLRLSGYKVYVECHFMKDRLLLYCYHFKQMDNKLFDKGVISKLAMKYGVEGFFEPNKDAIIDEDLTIVNCTDPFTINYVKYYGSDFYYQIESWKKEEWDIERNRLKKKQNELLRKL